MKRPLISCVVPVKGSRPFLDEAMASLRSQGLGEDLEIIVQDGDVESDGGIADALNRGFSKACGEWFFWLNADDVLLPGAIAGITSRLASPASPSPTPRAHEWISGNMVTIDERGRVLRCLRDRGDRAAYAGHPVRVFGPSSFFRRELFEEAGGCDVSLQVAMDTDLWLKFREHGHWFEKVDAYLFGFRRHAGSRTLNPDKSAEVQRVQDEEVARVHAAHRVKVDAAYLRRRRARRLFDGSYVRECFDTWRFGGRPWQEVRS